MRACHERGLTDVRRADALEALRAVDDGSLGVVIAMQVIEHIPYGGAHGGPALARAKLRPGGRLVVETVNPHAAHALKAFWVDPTHQHPLFPEVVLELCRVQGFAEGFFFFPNGTGDAEHDRFSEQRVHGRGHGGRLSRAPAAGDLAGALSPDRQRRGRLPGRHRLHGRRRAPDGLRPGLPDVAEVHAEQPAPSLETHGLIEFGNRVLSGFVGLAAVAAGVLAFFRKPFRRDLAVIGVLLPIGVVAQAVLGGLSVRYHLKPGFVMGHYALSMLILVACVSLLVAGARGAVRRRRRRRPRDGPRRPGPARARRPGGPRGHGRDRGRARTPAASGTGDVVNRLTFKGTDTLSWTVHAHSYIVTAWGLATVGTWWLARRRNAIADLQRTLTRLALLLALQGVVGHPSTSSTCPSELVWVHVVLATLAWVGLVRA